MSKLGSNIQCDSVIKYRPKESETCKGIVTSFWKEIEKGIKFKSCLQGERVTTGQLHVWSHSKGL